LTYELTDYPVFEEFSDAFLRALKIIDCHRTIEYCDRLGMRMLDAVQPLEGETLEQYLAPQALGFIGLSDEGLEHQHTLSESLFKGGSRSLLVRTARVPHGVAAPPDLMPLRLRLAKRFSEYQRETVMLDCDSADADRVDFSVHVAKEKLTELKSALSSSFKALVTPYALKIWE
jgi:uncharacterized protein (TIGR04255 family)